MSYNGETILYVKDNDVVPFSRRNLTLFSDPFLDIEYSYDKCFNFNNSFWSFDALKDTYGTRKVITEHLTSEEDLFTQIERSEFEDYIYIGCDLWVRPRTFLGFTSDSYDMSSLTLAACDAWATLNFKEGDIIYTPQRTPSQREIEVITFRKVDVENTACRIDRYNFRANYPKTYQLDCDTALITKSDDFENWRAINDFGEESTLSGFIDGQNIALLTY